MEYNKKMNVLVIGTSGAGKTTLINSIAGIEIEKGLTKKIAIYESTEWPLRFIDTKGFEYNIFEQMKTIIQIKNYSRKALKNKKDANDKTGIDAVWYCIEGTSRRTFEYNIKLMNKAIKGWKNVPVFVVITKSYSEVDIPKNIEEIEKVFVDNKKINLKKIVPVVAEEYAVNNELAVEPKGIEELCLATIDCFDEAKQINQENRSRLILNQKRFTAQSSVVTATGLAAGIAFLDRGNKADSILLIPIETGLVKIIFKIYNVKYSSTVIDGVMESGAITSLAKAIVGHFDPSQIVDAVVAGAIVFTIGEATVGAAEAAYKGLIKLDSISSYINKKIEDSPIVGNAINYLKENKDRLSELNTQEAIVEVKKFFEKNKNLA